MATLLVAWPHASLLAQSASAADPAGPTVQKEFASVRSGAATSGALQRAVRLDLHRVSLWAALEEIARQAGLSLAFSSGLVPSRKQVSIRTERISAREALMRALEDTDLDVLVSARGEAVLVKRPPLTSGAEPGPEAVQTGTIVGTVMSESEEGEASDPITGAQVAVEGTGLGTVADDAGRYRIVDVPAGVRPVTASFIGYRAVTQEVVVADGDTVTVDFTLAVAPTGLEAIVVTGTRIRGSGASAGTRLETIDRQQIETSGFATAQQVLQSLPQNFQGGQNEDTFVGAAGSNVTAGSSVNLHGLGADATLLLVNGRRVPVAGVNADFFDVSSIPVTAIDRIEVLSDGASAIYGSDAIAGVVNVILREDYEGAETRLRYGGVTQGDLGEFQLGQVFGKSWDKGNLLLSYEYYNRDPLPNADRGFADDSDLRPLGGDNFSTQFSSPGNILDPTTFQPVFAIPRGQDGRSLTPDDLLSGVVNYQNDNAFRNLLNDQEKHAAFATLSQNLGERVRLSAEGRFTTRDFDRRILGQGAILTVPSSNPFFVDPFGGSDAVTVAYNLGNDLGSLFGEGSVKTYGGVLGGMVALAGDWRLQLYGSSSREDTKLNQGGSVEFDALTAALADPDPATAFNPFGDGSHTNPATLEAIREDPSTETFDSRVQSVNVTTDGSLFRLPAGGVKLAAGLNFLRETYETTTTQESLDERFTRNVTSAFAEFSIPLVSRDNRRAGVERLALSIAGRFDDYSDVGTTTNPKVGAAWSPVAGLNIRGTWGTSFKAPKLADFKDQFDAILVLTMPDPSSQTGSTFALVRFGSNPDLKNETAEAWTAGLDFVPSAVPGLSLGLTYFNNHFRDRISTPRNVSTVLIEEDRFSSIITRDPSRAEIDALCDSPIFDPALGDCTLPITAIVDSRRNNTATTRIDGLDLALAYGSDTRKVGHFGVALNATYFRNFEEAITAIAPTVDIVGTVNQPIDFRMRNSLSWSHAGGLGATAFINYANDYIDNISVPERRVGSWTTADLTVEVNTQQRFGWLGDAAVSLSILNVFDTDPPFVNNPQGVGYDPENADPLGRFISFNVRKSW